MIGTSRISDIGSLVLGSVSHHLLRTTGRPVLIAQGLRLVTEAGVAVESLVAHRRPVAQAGCDRAASPAMCDAMSCFR